MGPTASGKTDLALALVRRFPCEIVSVDSAMVYRGMEIGTAKPDLQTQRMAPHRLIDIVEPVDPYSAARFRLDALAEMKDITARGKIPLLVGGTMLYFSALQYGLSEMPSANPSIRSQLVARAANEGWASLHDQLRQVDPVAAARIHCNDPQRIQRALEVWLSSGKRLSEYHHQSTLEELPYRISKLCVAPRDRQLLHERIAARFKGMLNAGLIEEVRGLRERAGMHSSLPSMRAVGYRQVWRFLDGLVGYSELLEGGIVATRQLAKRQLTWLRRDADVHWFDSACCGVEQIADWLAGELEQAN
jgi:tRNA dimethylallyltransferase